MTSALTSDDIEQFRDDGYVFLPGYFDADRVEEFEAETERLLEQEVNAALANDRKSERLSLAPGADGQPMAKSMNPSIDLSRVFKNLAVEELAEILEPLLDDTPVSIDRTAQINYKLPLEEPLPFGDNMAGDDTGGDAYPVHADWPYYEGRFPEGIVTTIVFVDECRPDSGPIEVWPGTHTESYDHESIDAGGREVPPDVLDHDAGEPVLGPAGSVLAFDSRLVHSSEPNTSGYPRRLAIYGHAPQRNVDVLIEDGSARPNATYPKELVESTYLGEYYRRKRLGEFTDQFTMPEFPVE
jgi:ectoine hydroxylase-related dioxygenase (phytanoyl-CoA dioxygenase family)